MNASSSSRPAILVLLLALALAADSTFSHASSSGLPAPKIQTTHAPAAVAPSAEDIRDIRGPVPIPYPWMWAVWTAAALAAAGAAFWAFRRWRRPAPIPPRLPHEIALEQLEAARALMDPARAREFSIAVSDAVRLYIEARFDTRAAHRTTEEFLHTLLANTASPLRPYSAALEDFLRHCDLAKFARWTLSATEMGAMHQSATQLVVETSPKPPVRGGPPPSSPSETTHALPAS